MAGAESLHEDPTTAVRLGFIELGNLGAPMALRLVEWPGGLTVFDVRVDAMTPLVEAGAASADSVADVAASSDIIGVTVLDDAQVREVIAGENGLARHAGPGTVIAIHSTICDHTAIELAAQLRPAGIHVIDAPITGGAPGANLGELAVMVGAEARVFQRIKEPFSWFASLIVHAGQVGAGTQMKLARNMMHFVSWAAASEAQHLAEECGLDIEALGNVVRHSDTVTGGPGAIMFRKTTDVVDPDDVYFPILSHLRGLGEKDLGLALALGAEHGVELPLAAGLEAVRRRSRRSASCTDADRSLTMSPPQKVIRC
jgi:3-hydroxyisobutyrate dehydrogenase-like beta-hydroxyacid dehydrogenase